MIVNKEQIKQIETDIKNLKELRYTLQEEYIPLKDKAYRLTQRLEKLDILLIHIRALCDHEFEHDSFLGHEELFRCTECDLVR